MMAFCVAPIRSLLALFKNTSDDTDQEEYSKQHSTGTEGKKPADSCCVPAVRVTAEHRGRDCGETRGTSNIESHAEHRTSRVVSGYKQRVKNDSSLHRRRVYDNIPAPPDSSLRKTHASPFLCHWQAKHRGSRRFDILSSTADGVLDRTV